MIQIPYRGTVILITCLWIVIRVLWCCREKKFSLKREAELMLVYICLIVVVIQPVHEVLCEVFVVIFTGVVPQESRCVGCFVLVQGFSP